MCFDREPPMQMQLNDCHMQHALKGTEPLHQKHEHTAFCCQGEAKNIKIILDFDAQMDYPDTR